MYQESHQVNTQSASTRKSTAYNKLIEWAQETNELPSKQSFLLRLACMTSNVATFSADLVKAIREDQELMQGIIDKAKLSGLNTKGITTRNLQQSIQRLGFNLVQNEVEINFAKRYVKAIQTARASHLSYQLRYLVRTALIAKTFAGLVQYKDAAMAFYAGFNHDIGTMVIGLRDPKAFRQIQTNIENGLDQKESELVALGFDHSELGARILRKWDMPPAIVDVARHHDCTHLAEAENLQLTLIVQLAVFIARSLKDKNKGPKAMWSRAEVLLRELGLSMTLEEWEENMRILFIQLIEFEDRVFVQG